MSFRYHVICKPIGLNEEDKTAHSSPLVFVICQKRKKKVKKFYFFLSNLDSFYFFLFSDCHR